jgi:hypothetical protein
MRISAFYVILSAVLLVVVVWVGAALLCATLKAPLWGEILIGIGAVGMTAVYIRTCVNVLKLLK